MTTDSAAHSDPEPVTEQTGLWSADGAAGDATTEIPPDAAQTQVRPFAWSADTDGDQPAEDYPPTGSAPIPDESGARNRLLYDPEKTAWRDARPWHDAFAIMAPWLFGAAVVAVVVAAVAYIWLQHDSRGPAPSAVQCAGTLTHTPSGGLLCAPAASMPPATVGHDCLTSECELPPCQHPVGQNSTVCKPTAAPPPTSEPAAAVLQRLQEQARTDKPAVDAMGGQWVPQLSSKQPGTRDDGIVYDDSSIWQEHSRLRQQYGAYLLWDNGYWITVASTSFPDKQSAQTWCDRAGRDADHCFPRLLPRQQPLAAPLPPAAADPAPDAHDRAFLAALRGAQINVEDPSGAVFGAHWVCGQLAGGYSRADVAAAVRGRDPALTALGAIDYVADSVAYYCPQYS